MTELILDVRKIEYFLTVFDHGNISNAAEQLRISQPTLSRQIHTLEQQFRTPLFIRHGRGVSPTEAGKRLEQGMRGLLHRLQDVRDDVIAAAHEPSGQVVLGIPPSPRTLFAVPIISAFCAAYPEVTIRIREGTSGDLRDLVARGDVDLAIINPNEPMHGLIAAPLASEPMLLIGPADAKLSLDVETPIEQLADVPLILTTRPNSLRTMVELELHHRGIRPRMRVEANTLPLITDLVAQGLGFTVLPSCGVYSLVKAGRLSASPLVGLRITWMIARQSDRSPSIAARLLQDVIFRIVRDTIKAGRWPLAETCRESESSANSEDNGGLEGLLHHPPATSRRTPRKIRPEGALAGPGSAD